MNSTQVQVLCAAICTTIGFGFGMAGCTQSTQSTPNTIVTRSEPGPSYFVHEVRLRDGTRCVVSTSGSNQGGTGITCDWAAESEERLRSQIESTR